MGSQEIEILQNVAMVLIRVAVPPLLTWAIVELKRYIEQIKTREGWWMLEEAIATAVAAAEQLGLTGQLSQYGDGKLDAAIQFVEKQLVAYGFPFDLDRYKDVIVAMIEAEVLRQFP